MFVCVCGYVLGAGIFCVYVHLRLCLRCCAVFCVVFLCVCVCVLRIDVCFVCVRLCAFGYVGSDPVGIRGMWSPRPGIEPGSSA